MAGKLVKTAMRGWVKRKRARAWAAKIEGGRAYIAALRNEYLNGSSTGVWDDTIDDQLQAAITSLASAVRGAEAIVNELLEVED